MIRGLSADNARPLPQQTAKRKPEKQDNFADQLMGAKPEQRDTKNDDRTERRNSGRDSNREEQRSAERERSSQRSPSDLRTKREEPRPAARAPERPIAEREERSEDDVNETNYAGAGLNQTPSQVSNHIQTPQQAPSDDEAPIIVEPKQDKEIKLPDFFSKASLEQGATKLASGKGTPNDTTAALAQMKDNEGLTRQEAMEKFVTKMNDELGIPPEKLLQAFAKLDDKAMQAAPEESMGQFLQALAAGAGSANGAGGKLDAAAEAKAGALYSDLLKTTGDSLVNEKLAGLDSGVNFDVMSPRDASLRNLTHSLSDMSNSFFRKGDPKQAQKNLEAMDVALAKLQKSAMPVDGQMQAQAAAVAPAAMLVDTNATSEQADAQALAGLMAQVQGSGSGMAQTLMSANEEGESDLADLLGGKGEAAVKSSSSKDALKSAFAEEMAKSDGADVPDLKVETLTKGDPSQVIAQEQPTLGAAGPKTMMGPSDMMMNRPSTPQDEQENVKDLIREAQVLVKRGGGEMKMEMRPEGMGHIQLRVNVENGQVNVQMLTDNESAKHLLEKGLSELKTNLAAHELKVQSMTVDVGNDVKNQLDQRGSQDHARQQARQFASDFMQDFRDNNQGFRQGLFENKGWKSYGRTKSPDSVGPEQVSRAASASTTDTSKRLNLVA